MSALKEECKLLAIIYKASDDLDSFTLFKRSKINFYDFNKLIDRLIKKAYIVLNDERVGITQVGIDYLHVKNQYLIDGNLFWRKTPPDYMDSRLAETSFYIPSLSRLDPRQFPKK